MKFKKLLLIPTLIIFSNFSLSANTLLNTDLPEHNDLVKAGDKYVVLLGNQVAIGEQAPDFKVVNESFAPVSLQDFTGKKLLISVVPSLDTGVCSLQTKRFNEELAKQPDDVVMLTISNDLPFAQKRFCKTENVDKIKVLSDAVWRDFGTKYGLLIKDMGLLTRAIFIIDEQGKITYKELVENIANHPDYQQALASLSALTAENQPPAKSKDSVQ
ncbi:thiol peroxidase [Thalassotalea sp. G2M2-11]|uniref:thiol peroxidase n=1 Tax=Thalassotalea sp. G2M2-11 TaxID=2787627 RepID=UPI0019D2A2AA|nr:thiol peroxidase [Thalassotalea sp. G2M2-11]